MDIEKIIYEGILSGASDIHLMKGMNPVFRINKELIIKEEIPKLTSIDIDYAYRYFVKGDEKLNEQFKKEKNLDMHYDFNTNRLRVNISIAMDSYVFTIRIIKKELPNFEELKLPEILKKAALIPQGLILVTGKSNTGKTTTLNALVNLINRTESKKIIMLENPIEYIHNSKKSIIIQREVGNGKDCSKYSNGVKNALREDCDMLIVGEIRDKETMDATLEMVESGHLVIGTMHTRSCAETIDRILGFYEISDQTSVKYVISSVLKMVITQRLVKGINTKLMMIPEIMVVDDVIGGLIRKEKFSTSEIEDAIQTRMDRGNLSLINSLANSVLDEKITIIEAEKQIEETKHQLLNRTIRNLERLR